MGEETHSQPTGIRGFLYRLFLWLLRCLAIRTLGGSPSTIKILYPDGQNNVSVNPKANGSGTSGYSAYGYMYANNSKLYADSPIPIVNGAWILTWNKNTLAHNTAYTFKAFITDPNDPAVDLTNFSTN